MAKKKSKRKAAGRVVGGVTCLKCGVNRAKSSFLPSEKLLYGVSCWCNECLKWKETLDGPELGDARTLYEKHYQKRYQPSYKAKKQGKAARTIKRLTRHLMRGVLEEEFDIAALRRPEVMAHLAWVWEDLKDTETWREFEEEVEASADGRCQGCGEFDEYLTTVRLFDVKLYPELALYEGNAQMLCEECTDDREEKDIGLVFSQEGLEQAVSKLRECLLEVG